MIDNWKLIAVKLRRQGPFSERHPHSIRESLAQRAGRCLDASGVSIFWVTWRP
jgi:hypothetical protein